MLTPVARRLIKLQRQIHKTVRADVRRLLGPQPAELKRYYEAYKREFRGEPKRSSKEELLRECRKADVILLGDYHAFPQSQRTALRLLRELADPELADPNHELMLCLEMVPTTKQDELDAYMQGKIDDDEFLKRIDYASSWGFPYENFKPLLMFAREHHIPVIALNHASDALSDRDRHAAALLAAVLEARPKARLFVLYGDLHLARGHIPKLLRHNLEQRRLAKRRALTVFQNSETVYWRLATQGVAHEVDVVALGRGRYCVMNAAPWVKLQSYLEWTESNLPLDPEDDAEIDLHELTHERLRNLSAALGFKLPEGFDFTVLSSEDLGFLDRLGSDHGLSRDEAKAIKLHVLANRSALVPGAKLAYLASSSPNALNEVATMLAHVALSGAKTVFHDPKEHFFGATMVAALAYFGSKTLNHKRKCDMEDDFRLLLERRLVRGALPQEKLQRKVAKLVLTHLAAQREYLRAGPTYRAPFSVRGPSQRSVFLDATRRLGAILGEKLYASFMAGQIPAEKVTALFSAPLNDSREARQAYLELVADLAQAPLLHTSKQDRL